VIVLEGHRLHHRARRAGVVLIPEFLILQRLSLFDTYYGMILPLLADAVGILLMKTVFEAVPYELERPR